MTGSLGDKQSTGPETGWVAGLIDTTNACEVEAYQRLRYDCFVLRRGWVRVDPSRPGREVDRYDPFCHHLGVFQGATLMAYLRALPWRVEPGFMLHHEFRNLISDDVARSLSRPGTVELSRLIVAGLPGTGHSETLALTEVLFRLVYNLGKDLGWTAYCVVLEESWLRILNRRFNLPFAPLGLTHIFPDGTRTLAAAARCATVEQSMRESLPIKFDWYQQDATLE